MSGKHVMKFAGGYLLLAGLERAFTLAIVPITTRLFTDAEFAQLFAITNITNILNLTVGLFLVRGLPAILAALPNDSVRRDAALTIFLGTIFLGLIALVVTWALAPSIGKWLDQPDSFVALLQLALCSMFVVLVGQCLFATSRSLELHSLAIGVQCLALIAQVGCVLALLLLAQIGPASQLWAGLAAGATAIAAYLPRLTLLIVGKPELEHLTRAGQVSAHLMAFSIGTHLILNCPGLILNWAGQTTDAAAFGIAAGAAGLGTMAAFAFYGAWTPHMLRRAKDPTLAADARRVFEEFSAASLIAGSFGALFAREVFTALVGERFIDSYRLVPPLIGTYAVFAIAHNFSQGMLLDARPRRFAWIGLVTSAIFIAMALPAARLYGAAGLIVSMALAFALMTVLAQVASYSVLQIRYPWAKHSAIWVTVVPIVGWAAYLPLGLWPATTKCALMIGLITILYAAGICPRLRRGDPSRDNSILR